jgi:hypothetical protein
MIVKVILQRRQDNVTETVAEGGMDTDKLADAHVLVREGRYFAFQRMDGFTRAIFDECTAPVEVTEF